MLLSKICLFLLVALWLPDVVAQHTVTFNQIRRDPVDVLASEDVDLGRPGSMIDKHVGNVKLRHQGVLLFCDRATRNSLTNKIDAYGHVLIVQGDSIVARGDTMTYDGNDRHVTLRGRVMFQDRRTVLATTQLDYYLPSGIAYYDNQSRIAKGNNVLTNQGKGYYNARTKQFISQRDSRLADSEGMPRLKSIIQDKAGLLTTATVSNQMTLLDGRYTTDGSSAKERERTVAVETPENALRYQTTALPSVVAGAVMVVKKTLSLPNRLLPVGKAAKRQVAKAWVFNEPVVGPAGMSAIMPNPENLALKNEGIEKISSPNGLIRQATFSQYKPAVVDRATATLPIKQPVTDPVESDLERELNRTRRSKLSNRVNPGNAQ